MTQETNREINAMITTLYLTRGQVATPDTIGAWLSILGSYPVEKLKPAFHNEIKYGSQFPSLPAIISRVEGRADCDTQAIEAWASVMKAVKASSSKGLTADEKNVLLTVCSGLSEVMDADAFRRSTIERDYKKMYVAMLSGTSKHVKPEAIEHTKQLTENLFKG